MLKLIIFVVIIGFQFVTSYNFNSSNNLKINENERSIFDENLDHITVSLDQFIVFKELGSGGFGQVYLVMKKGGSDDGKLYAMKAINISATSEMAENWMKVIYNERKMLEMSNGLPWATGIHYAYRDGNWPFLVMDLAIGESVPSRLINCRLSADKSKIFAAETIIAIEKLHSAKIQHNDLSLQNMLVDGDGHVMLNDFGFASELKSDASSSADWVCYYGICNGIFTEPLNEEQIDFLELYSGFEKLTDSKLTELKNHSYFEGIDWNKLSAKQFEPPFASTELHFNMNNTLDLRALLEIVPDEALDPTFIESLRHYTYVAPEHQNQSK